MKMEERMLVGVRETALFVWIARQLEFCDQESGRATCSRNPQLVESAAAGVKVSPKLAKMRFTTEKSSPLTSSQWHWWRGGCAVRALQLSQIGLYSEVSVDHAGKCDSWEDYDSSTIIVQSAKILKAFRGWVLWWALTIVPYLPNTWECAFAAFQCFCF